MKRKHLHAFMVLAGLEAFAASVWLFLIPSDGKNAVMWGFSWQRLLLIGIGIFLGVACLTGWYLSNHRNRFLEQVTNMMQCKAVRTVVLIACGLLVMVLLIPQVSWGQRYAVIVRLRPLLVWWALINLEWYLATGNDLSTQWAQVKKGISSLGSKSGLGIIFGLVALVVLYIASLNFYPLGVREDYWYETGVPILLWQVLICLCAAGLFDRWVTRFRVSFHNRKTDHFLFVGLFLFFGLLWGFANNQPGYFNPHPPLPNDEMIPNSDASLFDLQGQSALVGLGLDAGTPLDRPFYPTFLAMLHAVIGQNYGRIMAAQAFLFATLPAVLYLIFAELDIRKVGVFSAAMVGLWGINVITANHLISTSTPKLMMTEFPLAVTIVWVLYIGLRWLNSQSHRPQWSLVLGACLALAAYIRYSALLLLPVWVLGGLIKFQFRWKPSTRTIGLMMAGFLLFTAPWYLRNISAGQRVTLPFSGKVSFVLRTRYEPSEAQEKPSSSWQDNQSMVDEAATGREAGEEEDDEWKDESAIPFTLWFPTHLIHNLMSSLLVLPTSLENANLETTINLGGEIWNIFWVGELPWLRLFLFLFQGLLVLIGVFHLYRIHPAFSVVMVLSFGAILTANAFGRSSGGRYLVPVNWLVLILYGIGLVSLVWRLPVRHPSPTAAPKHHAIHWRELLATAVVLTVMGTSPVLFEVLTRSMIRDPLQEASLETVSDYLIPEQAEAVEAFMTQKKAGSIGGFAFHMNQTDDLSDLDRIPKQYRAKQSYPYLYFNLVTSEGFSVVLFPYSGAININNQDRVVVLGCKMPGGVMAHDLWVIGENGAEQYLAEPGFETCDALVPEDW
ncbi:MAG: hypothetical protein HPY85_07665 [Anaerolineae bacterium]|nr:hypothetical protein [Anaerolineae bacterium]